MKFEYLDLDIHFYKRQVLFPVVNTINRKRAITGSIYAWRTFIGVMLNNN